MLVNEWLQTAEPGVYAIGDLAGPPWLAHKAMHEGVVAVERIAGVKGLHPLDVSKVPGCTYCWPQVASVGMSEAKAKAAGREVKVGRFPYIGNGKAIARELALELQARALAVREEIEELLGVRGHARERTDPRGSRRGALHA